MRFARKAQRQAKPFIVETRQSRKLECTARKYSVWGDLDLLQKNFVVRAVGRVIASHSRKSGHSASLIAIRDSRRLITTHQAPSSASKAHSLSASAGCRRIMLPSGRQVLEPLGAAPPNLPEPCTLYNVEYRRESRLGHCDAGHSISSEQPAEPIEPCKRSLLATS